MNKAVFLDRDGVINKELGHYATNIDAFVINDDIAESIYLLKERGYIVIIISNQGGIAKKLYSNSDVLAMHDKLQSYLKKHNTYVDDFYFCPHHQDFSKCICRKPDNLMLQKAIASYKINISKSFMIGDSERDIIAAKKTGISGILIEPNTSILNICKEIILNK